MSKKQPLLLGAHISIAGGLDKAVERAKSINCSCFQIFTKSNRQWNAKPLQQKDIDDFKKALSNYPTIKSTAVHCSYLINIGSDNKELNKKSTESLNLEMKRALDLSIPYLILHPGSYGTSSLEKCINLIAQNINKVLEENPGATMLLLENMAGQGSAVGYTFEQLAEIYNKVDQKERIGFCFDTCHAFVAGYDFRDQTSYKKLWDDFDKILGIEKIKVFHINDSKKDLGSRVDRHEDIGQGKLGIEAFRLLFNDTRFFNIPKILETPKENLIDDLKNINILKNLINDSTKTKISIL